MQTTLSDRPSEEQFPEDAYARENKWLDRPILTRVVLSVEIVAFVLIMILAVATRFYDLESRVMSHDENSHVYYSWLLSRGQGYSHDPVTHGPFQFHVVALSYFLFGDSDTTARIPAVLFSIATVAFLWNYRRYLGRAGALVAAALMVISPYMLYYGRYVRNESYVAFFGLVTLWAILRYLETGSLRYLLYLTAATILHFTTKETAFIYTAQALLFLGFYFVYRITIKPWQENSGRNYFLISLLVALLLIAGAGAIGMLAPGAGQLSAGETAPPAVPGQGLDQPDGAGMGGLPLILMGLGVAALIVSLYFLITGYGWQRLRLERSFGLLILLGTLVLPMLAPFPVHLLGENPINYNDPRAMAITATVVVLFILASIGIGLLWNPRIWLLNAALFYGVFTILFTTIFTNGFGFVTGLVGSLGYWLAQQEVNRGSQPLYYYALIQVPIYEYLPALGSFLALGIALFRRRTASEAVKRLSNDEPADAATAEAGAATGIREEAPVLALLGFWAVTSLLAYTIAGEKMPWLTVHITLPMILLSGWSLGYLIDTTDWYAFRTRRGWLIVLLLPVLLVSFMAALGSMLGARPPFQGRELEQLRSTTLFITALLTAIGSSVALSYLIKPWSAAQFARLVGIVVFAFLGFLTARTAIQASYINYDDATEYLVYAHSAGGVKEALAQIEEISRRTSGGLSLTVAYDDQTTYPYWWYLRNYPNQQFFGANPTRSLRDAPVILVGDSNFGKIEPVVGQAYHRFDYVRLWWPNQDYFGLTWERVLNTLRDPLMREAVFQVWLNRDYTRYGQLTGKDLSLPNWYPSARMRLYVRKDIAAQIWNYGTMPTAEEIVADPYEGKGVNLSADLVIGGLGAPAGVEGPQFARPRGLVVAEDGTLYVADTGNHRVLHLAADGSLLDEWGSYSGDNAAEAPVGTFNEPWGIALGPDGAVFVTDTWNHRIQKFSPDGEFLATWGFFGQATQPEAFWGPRDVVVDSDGRVFVTDTGNKRVVVFDSNGGFITQFGEVGLGTGQFDEPVGLALDSAGRVYVVDTWNQRVQVFALQGSSYQPVNSWDVVAWYGQSLDNKPFIDVNDQGQVFVTDPEGYRVLAFTDQGEFLFYWGDYGVDVNAFGLAGAVASDQAGGVWVSDAGNNRLLHFTLPSP